MKALLLGHHDLDSAYVSPRARHWIESRPHFGQRVCLRGHGDYRISKLSYDAAVVYYIDEAEGFSVDSLWKGASLSEIDAFIATYPAAMNDAPFREAIAWARESAFRRGAIRPSVPVAARRTP